MIELCGLFWANDLLKGNKPIFPREEDKKANTGEFGAYLDKAIKEIQYEKEISRGKHPTRYESDVE